VGDLGNGYKVYVVAADVDTLVDGGLEHAFQYGQVPVEIVSNIPPVYVVNKSANEISWIADGQDNNLSSVDPALPAPYQSNVYSMPAFGAQGQIITFNPNPPDAVEQGAFNVASGFYGVDRSIYQGLSSFGDSLWNDPVNTIIKTGEAGLSLLTPDGQAAVVQHMWDAGSNYVHQGVAAYNNGTLPEFLERSAGAGLNIASTMAFGGPEVDSLDGAGDELAANWGTGPLRPPAREVLPGEGDLIGEAQGLQSRAPGDGPFDDVVQGEHGDPETKYLYTVDERGVNIAPEQTPAATPRGVIVHTNISSEASVGGEVWFGPDNTVTINAGSGRFGDGAGVTEAQWNATAQLWESLGYKVNPIPLGGR
jgi:hypothetical protein